MKSFLNRIKQHWDNGGKIVLLSVFIFALVAFMLLYILLTGGPKTPMTADQVFEILEAEGYAPKDAMETFRQNGFDDAGLISVVQVSSTDFTFTFFEHQNKDGAQSLYRRYASVIFENVYKTKSAEYKKTAGNYNIYSIQTDEYYAINFRVENTEIFAVGSSESASDIHEILVKIGYYDE